VVIGEYRTEPSSKPIRITGVDAIASAGPNNAENKRPSIAAPDPHLARVWEKKRKKEQFFKKEGVGCQRCVYM
jgi:hypothetical protein